MHSYCVGDTIDLFKMCQESRHTLGLSRHILEVSKLIGVKIHIRGIKTLISVSDSFQVSSDT